MVVGVGRPSHYWTPSALKTLECLRHAGHSRQQIAEALGVPLLAVVGRVYRTGRNFQSRYKIPDGLRDDSWGWRRYVWLHWVLPRLQRHSGRGCWIWPGNKTLSGYGKVNVRVDGARAPRAYRLHRLALELKIKRLLKPKELACHRCDVPACLRPGHLYAGNSQDNMRDRDLRGRGARGERHGNSRFSNDQVTALRALRAIIVGPRGVGLALLARAAGTSPGYLQGVLAVRYRKHD